MMYLILKVIIIFGTAILLYLLNLKILLIFYIFLIIFLVIINLLNNSSMDH
jgi:hypothetical protein